MTQHSLSPEELASFLTEGVTDYAFVTFGVENRVTSWSKGAELIFGYREAEILGKSGEIIFTEEDRASGEEQKELGTALREGRAEDERWHRRKDGSRFWGSGVMTAIRDEAGRHVGFAKVMRDLTERRKAVEALRASEQQFQAVANLVPDLLWTNDAEGNVIWRNQRWTEYSGCSLDPAEGFHWTDAVHPDDIEAARARLFESLGSGAPFQHDVRLRRRDGAYRWFLARAEPVRAESGEILHWFGAATDIDEQRAELDVAKDELRALAARLLTMQEEERRRIARELHDSVGQQLGVAQAELTQLREARNRETVKIVDRLERQIEALSDEIRSLSHRLHPSVLEDLGLAAALRALAAEFERTHRIPVRVDIEDGLAPILRTAATAVYRVSQEALQNVRKHAGDGTKVAIRLRGGDALHMEVRDDGPGFDVEAVRAKGGLGIVSMRERARAAHGSLRIDSARGRGTTVALTIPWENEQVLPAKPRVLIADDHEASRYILRRFAAAECEIVAEVGNGAEALQEAARLQPDLVILDVSMPVMGGVEAARLMHARFPEIRLIFASQHTNREYVEEAFRAGGHGYIVKQAAATEMGEAIREVLAGRQFRSRLAR